LRYPPDFIERVRESTNIVDIIGQTVALRRSGHNFQGLCPFHHEKSPSFSVSEDKQVYHCFGCKASGNVYSFIRDNMGMSFAEAVEYLARRAGLPIPQVQSSTLNKSGADTKSLLLRVNAVAAVYYHQQLLNLPEDHPVREYLRGRALTPELISAFRLGYAPDAWSELALHFARQKVPVPPSEQLGLIKKRDRGQGHYDLFRHRLMFPIFSTSGPCLGFGGRALKADQAPKYLNSPDSPVFHKGGVFYGLQHSAKFIRQEDEAIIVEGYMDFLALAKVGINNMVATLGTAFTADHARLLQRFTKRVVLLFDGDEAGKSAARRSLPILLSEGLLARGVFLPNNEDPDEYLKAHTADDLRRRLAEAPDLFDLISTELWLEAKGSPSGKVQILDELAPMLAGTKDARLKRLYAQNLANLLEVPIKIVEQSVMASAKSVGSIPQRRNVSEEKPPELAPAVTPPAQIDLTKAPRLEVELLNLILTKEVYLKEALASGVGLALAHAGTQRVWQRIVEVYGQMPSKFDTLTALLVGEVKPVELITKHLVEEYSNYSDETSSSLLQGCIKRIKEKALRLKSKELVSELRGTGTSAAVEQLEQFMNIQKNRRSLDSNS